jgi:DNA-binding NarL/FixJ family response regulator
MLPETNPFTYAPPAAVKEQKMAGYEVLVLDDESGFLHNLAWVLSRDGFQVTVESHDLPRHSSYPDLAGFDLIAGRVDSSFGYLMDLIGRFKKANPNGAAIVLSKDYDYTFPLEAFELKIDDYILMPGTLGEVRRRFIRCLNEVKLKYLAVLSNRTVSEVNRRAFKLLADANPLRINCMPKVKSPAASGLKTSNASRWLI